MNQSIKELERSRRAEAKIIETTIRNIEQNLPIEMEKFWGSPRNKMQLEQMFIEWVLKECKGSKPLYLGGANRDDITSCYKVMDGNISAQPLLKCCHEEADDRIIFHVNHAVKLENYSKIIIASSDTDVLINSIYHCSRWMQADIEELWVVCGNKLFQCTISLLKWIPM